MAVASKFIDPPPLVYPEVKKGRGGGGEGEERGRVGEFLPRVLGKEWR